MDLGPVPARWVCIRGVKDAWQLRGSSSRDLGCDLEESPRTKPITD